MKFKEGDKIRVRTSVKDYGIVLVKEASTTRKRNDAAPALNPRYQATWFGSVKFPREKVTYVNISDYYYRVYTRYEI